jgi:hypothetical protein
MLSFMIASCAIVGLLLFGWFSAHRSEKSGKEHLAEADRCIADVERIANRRQTRRQNGNHNRGNQAAELRLVSPEPK